MALRHWRFGLMFGFAAFCSHAQNYFPPLSLGHTEKLHKLKADWYSEQLTSLHEDSLWTMSHNLKANEVYRFLWLRSFHNPICIKLSIAGVSAGLLTAKESDGRGGFKAGKLIREETRSMTTAEITQFREQLRAVDFWSHSSRQKYSEGTDGSDWILEGERRGSYQIVDKWSPSPGDPLRVLGMMLVRQFAHLQLANSEVY